MEIEADIQYGLTQLGYQSISETQLEAVKAYLDGNDVLFCSPTGSGKSLTFEIAPFVLSYKFNYDALPKLSAACIVISPLVALMRSQVTKLRQFGMRAVYLPDACMPKETDLDGVANTTFQDVEDGSFDILLCSPETILGDHRKLLLKFSEDKKVKAIFIDEAHCIRKFGKTGLAAKRPAFRPCYGKLGELRSLAGPDIPVIALTATATAETQSIIKKELCMDDAVDIILSPNKPNIRYSVYVVNCDDVRQNFEWLVTLLNNEGIASPRMIIFFRRVEHMSVVFKHVIYSLGRNAYVNYNENGQNDDRNRLIDMFHMKTDDTVKTAICKSYEDPLGSIRVVLCTTSFSMGLDVKGVDTVIHYGPANDLEDYIQETGRAGRDADQYCHGVIIKYKRSLGSTNISKPVKQYVLATTCRRKVLMGPFMSDSEPVSPTPQHLCCDICTDSCKCLCTCDTNVCDCEILCDYQESTINRIMKQSTQTSSESSESENTGFSSDSDFEGYIAKKPTVVYDTDDSSDQDQ